MARLSAMTGNESIYLSRNELSRQATSQLFEDSSLATNHAFPRPSNLDVICQSEYKRSYGRSRSVSPQPGDALAHGKAGSREERLGYERRGGPAAGARAHSASVVTARNKENNHRRTAASAGSDPPLCPRRQRPEPVAGRAHSRSEKAERLYESASGVADAGSPLLLTAQQMLRPCRREAAAAASSSSSSSSSSFRLKPVAMETKAHATEPQSRPLCSETEYRRNFRGASPPRGPPRLRKFLECRQRVPLSDTRGKSQRMRKESEMMPHPQHAGPASQSEATPPPQVQRQHRNLLTEYEANFPFPQCGDTGETPQVMLLRQKARWYRRRAWGTNFSRQHLSQLKSQHNILWEPDGGGPRRPASVPRPSPRAEPPDLASRPCEGPAAIEDGEDEDDKGAGRFPTPEKYGGPLHRTHLDLTTPTCAGGGMLVGKATSREAFQRRHGGDPAAHAELPPEGPAASRPSSAPPPTRVIRGLLRHAEFQHNGERRRPWLQRPDNVLTVRRSRVRRRHVEPLAGGGRAGASAEQAAPILGEELSRRHGWTANSTFFPLVHFSLLRRSSFLKQRSAPVTGPD
ncbi:nuclear protein MDM1 isoform X4 [Syngnathus scovelli]|uniref:nuclear protein MDM1 isoform X4 n=1 Tax=Syngnathus scovelli TaxID=161590 RepID=UPI0035C9BD3D